MAFRDKIRQQKRRIQGRKRVVDAQRYPDGSVVRPERESILPETIQRRADFVGMDHAMSDRAGFPLGRLSLQGFITERQFQAGIKFENACLKWARLAGAKPHYAMCGERDGGIPADPTSEEWARAETAYYAAWAAAEQGRPKVLACRAIEQIILDLEFPITWSLPIVFDALRSGLDCLAEHFGLPDGMERKGAA